MNSNILFYINLLLVWLGYFVLHSTLASLAVKNWVTANWPRLDPFYRLIYNLAATLLLIPPLWLLHASHADPLWVWRGIWRWFTDGLAITALLGFWRSMHYYDLKEFLGLRQARRIYQNRRFSLSPFHRFVRHPWYFFGLVIIWTRDMDPAWLLSCTAITLYLAVGSRQEERKLIAEFGDVYRRYQARVPALIPLPSRYLSRTEAEELAESAKQGQ